MARSRSSTERRVVGGCFFASWSEEGPTSVFSSFVLIPNPSSGAQSLVTNEISEKRTVGANPCLAAATRLNAIVAAGMIVPYVHLNGERAMIYRSGEGPCLGAFLEFLTEQMQAQPHLIRGLTSLERAEALVEGVEVDPNEDLGGDTVLD